MTIEIAQPPQHARMALGKSGVSVRAVTAFIVVAAVNVALLWNFHDRYWYPVDEGVYATIAERILAGEVLHVQIQDFHPGYGDFLNAAAFRLFGIALVSLRYPLVTGAFLQSLFVFALLSRRSLLLASSAAVASIALGVVHFLNPTSHWYALYGTCALVYWLTWAPPYHWIRLAGAGILIGTIALFHQLVGVLVGTAVLAVALQEQSRDAKGVERRLAQLLLVAPLAGLLLYLVRASTMEFSGVLLFAAWPLAILLRGLISTRTANRDAGRILLSLAAGALVSAMPLILYSLVHGSSWHTLHESLFAALSLGVRTSTAQPWYGALSLAGLYQAVTPSTPSDVVNGLFWAVLPMLAAVNGLVIWFSQKEGHADRSPLPTVSAFYAVSSLYMQDAIYLFFSAGLSLASILWWLSTRGRAATVAGTAGAIALSVTAVVFHAAQPSTRSSADMLRGVDVLSGEWSLPLDRARLRLDRVEQQQYATVVNVIQTSAPAGAPMLAVPNDPELYFLSARRNPFPFYNTGIGIQSQADLGGVLDRLRREPPAVVTFRLEDQYNTWSSSAIMEHVRRHYDRIADVGGVEIYRIRR